MIFHVLLALAYIFANSPLSKEYIYSIYINTAICVPNTWVYIFTIQVTVMVTMPDSVKL